MKIAQHKNATLDWLVTGNEPAKHQSTSAPVSQPVLTVDGGECPKCATLIKSNATLIETNAALTEMLRGKGGHPATAACAGGEANAQTPTRLRKVG